MNPQPTTEVARELSLSTRLSFIAVAMIAVGVLSILVGGSIWNVNWMMAIAALVACVISSLAAHVAGEYPSGDDYFAARLAGSMAARTAPPFLFVIIAKVVPAIPFESGFVFFIVLFYLVGLVVDVSLQVRRLKQVG